MAKQHFQNGMLDKAGKNVKTDKGWVSVKGNEHLINHELNKNREVVHIKEKSVKAEKEIKEKKQTKKAVKEEQTVTRNDKHKNDEKWRMVSKLKNFTIKLACLHKEQSKADFHFYEAEIKNLKDDLKEKHDYVMDAKESKTKYKHEMVNQGDTIFVNGEEKTVLNVDDDHEGFMYKIEKGAGQSTIDLIDERPK